MLGRVRVPQPTIELLTQRDLSAATRRLNSSSSISPLANRSSRIGRADPTPLPRPPRSAPTRVVSWLQRRQKPEASYMRCRTLSGLRSLDADLRLHCWGEELPAKGQMSPSSRQTSLTRGSRTDQR